MPSHRSIGHGLATTLAVLVGTFALSSAALAHVFPKKQEPGAGATVSSPAQVRILFDGPLEPSFTTLSVTDASGKQVNVEKASIDPQQPATVSVALPALVAGHYTVHWAAVASDGHRTHGDYSFDVK
jgi:methionine-rich copper-binding protein CopC